MGLREDGTAMRNRFFAFAAVGLLAMTLAMALECAGQQFVVPVQKLPLTKAANNIDGWLEVLADSRISPELRAKMWEKGDWETVLGAGDPLRASFAKDAPDDAALRISLKNGFVTKVEPLDRPLATVKPEAMPGGEVIFLVTVDYSSGADAALSTRFVQIHGSQFEWLDARSGKDDPRQIRLPKNEKADWKFSDDKNVKDILQVFSRPSTLESFETAYVRYHFNGKLWVRTEKLEPGDWDSTQPFPAETKFP